MSIIVYAILMVNMESLNTKSSLPGLDLAGNWKPSNKVIQSVCRVCWMWWSDERDINVT